MRHWTSAGKVVYKRPRHEWSIQDLIRCTRNLDPMGPEVPYIVPYALEVSALLIRCLDTLAREAKVPKSLVSNVALEALKVLSQAIQVLIPVSEDAVEAIKVKVKQDLGIK